MRNTCHGGALRTKLTPWNILILPLGKYTLLWLVIKRTHLESINCCESGSTANGLNRTLCMSVAAFSFVELSWASPYMGLSLPSLLEMFLVAIVAFQGEGYSWVRHTSWKLKRHAVRSCDILRPERKKFNVITLNTSCQHWIITKNFCLDCHLHIKFWSGPLALLSFLLMDKIKWGTCNLGINCQETNGWFDMQPYILLVTDSKLSYLTYVVYA